MKLVQRIIAALSIAILGSAHAQLLPPPDHYPAHFAGISVSATAADLITSGFECVERAGVGVDCIDRTFRSDVFGIKIGSRSALFVNGQMVSIRVTSVPYPDPKPIGATLRSSMRSNYKPAPAPRVMASSDNSRREFWYLAPGYTLVSGFPRSASTPGKPGEQAISGGVVVSIGVMLPTAH